MCGNSLGLKPKQADEYMREQLGSTTPPPDQTDETLPLRELGSASSLHALHWQDPSSACGEYKMTIFICLVYQMGKHQDQPGKAVTAALVGADSPKEVRLRFFSIL